MGLKRFNARRKLKGAILTTMLATRSSLNLFRNRVRGHTRYSITTSKQGKGSSHTLLGKGSALAEFAKGMACSDSARVIALLSSYTLLLLVQSIHGIIVNPGVGV